MLNGLEDLPPPGAVRRALGEEERDVGTEGGGPLNKL